MESEHPVPESSKSCGTSEALNKRKEKGHLNPWERAKHIKPLFQKASVKFADQGLTSCFQQASKPIISDDTAPDITGKFLPVFQKASKPETPQPISQIHQQPEASTSQKSRRQADVTVPVIEDPTPTVPVVKRVPTFGVPRAKVPKYSTCEKSKNNIKKIPLSELESCGKTSPGLVSASTNISPNSAIEPVSIKKNPFVSCKSTGLSQSTTCESQRKIGVSSSNKKSVLKAGDAAPSTTSESRIAPSFKLCNKKTVLNAPLPQSKSAPARPSFGKKLCKSLPGAKLAPTKRTRSPEELSNFENSEAIKTEVSTL